MNVPKKGRPGKKGKGEAEMTEIKVYRLALNAVERDLDNTTRQIQEKPELRKYLKPEHEELMETRKTLIKKIDELSNK